MAKQRVNRFSGLKIEDAVRESRGRYTVAEVARYARISVPRLNYWLYGDREHSALHQPTITRTEGKWLTFLEFVQVLAARTLRNQYHLSFQKIRAAVNEARDAYGIEYPFANQDHQAFLVGSDLHIQLKGAPAPVGLTGKDKKQQSLRPCIEPFMENLEFDDKKTAMAFIAYRYPIPNEAAAGLGAGAAPSSNIKDECCSKRLARRISDTCSTDNLSVQTKHLSDFCGVGKADEDWLPLLERKGGWIVITADRGKDPKKQKLRRICGSLGITHISLTPALIREGYQAHEKAMLSVFPEIIHLHLLPKGTKVSLGFKWMSAGGQNQPVVGESKPAILR